MCYVNSHTDVLCKYSHTDVLHQHSHTDVLRKHSHTDVLCKHSHTDLVDAFGILIDRLLSLYLALRKVLPSIVQKIDFMDKPM